MFELPTLTTRSGFQGEKNLRALSLIALALLFLQAGKARALDEGAALELFEKKIRPVLVERCYKCHSAGSKKLKGKLRLDNLEGLRKGGESGAAITPGKPAESLVLSALRYDELKMPPGGKLPEAVAKDFETWIQLGAPVPDSFGSPAPVTAAETTIDWKEEAGFWSFRPLTDYPVEQANGGVPPRNRIDSYVFSQLAGRKLRPRGEADRRTLIRRLTYNLIGLPPTPAEINDFVSDKDPRAWDNLVTRLLASPHYGERWGRHWLDVVRYADSNGADENKSYPLAYHYRNYVIDAFNQDLPFDEFVREQLAGDLLPDPRDAAITNRRLTATTYLAMGIKIDAEKDGEKKRSDIIDEQIDTISRSLLGVTVACARCHDHKFDPIPTTDYYAMAGVLRSTDLANRKLDSGEKQGLQKEIERLGKDLEEMRSQADARIAGEARKKIAAYLEHAIGVLQWQRHSVPTALQVALADTAAAPYTPASSTVNIEQISRLQLLREAETYNRGTARPDENYGKGIGIISDKGAPLTWAEYDLELPEEGTYQVEFRYAAAASRPGKLSVNGKVVNEKSMAQVTGSWYPDSQKWFVEGRYKFNAGRNTLRFEAAGLMSHLDKLVVARVRALSAPVTEAESFQRGNVKPYTSDDVVYISDPANTASVYFMEYDIEAPVDGTYSLLLRYAALESRPMALSIDGKVISEKALAKTSGGWDAAHQRWHREAEFELSAGGHTLRFERKGAVSHLDQLRLVPPAASNRDLPSPAQLATRNKLDLGALHQWARFIATQARPNAPFYLLENLSHGRENFVEGNKESLAMRKPGNPISRELLTPVPKIPGEFAARAGLLVTAALAEDRIPMLEPLHQALTGKQGPFTPYRHTTTHYSRGEQEAVNALSQSISKLENKAKSLPTITVMAVKDASATDHPVYIRGNHLQKGPIVPRRFLTIVEGLEQAEYPEKQSGRLRLANSIVSPSNPLTARVIANRVWRWHFGRALVKTTENFGHSGEQPSHPELLDHLALKLIEFKWSIKKLNRYIVSSHTYRMGGSYAPQSAAIDPGNRWYWRFQPRRLEAEVIRDAFLFTAGRLDRTLGGGPTTKVRSQDPSPENLRQNRAFYESSRRRSVYLPIIRTNVYKLFTLFDFPNPAAPTGNRTTTTVPTQALFLMNNPWMNELAGDIAKNVTATLKTDRERFSYLYESLLGRLPEEDDLTAAENLLETVREQADLEKLPLADWQALCHTMLMSSEFLYTR